MFGSSNPFGQSSSSFGSPSVFGSSTPFGSQTGSSIFGGTTAGSSSTTNNPFAPKPFGGTTPFGAQTGSSIFGGTSTGMFGAAQSSSPFSASTAFGASSSSPFGSSMPAFGASSSPAFGASSSPAFGASSSAFGASSAFGQKPAFGGFGSTAQTSPFGSTPQQSQPAFGSSLFGSSTPFGQSSPSPFGAASTPAFGAASTPAFGATSSPAFGSTSTPAFGATSQPAFGVASAPAFGSTSTPAFGSTGTAFGASTTPVFGSSSTPAFGATSTSVFGSSSPSMFGASSSPAFGASSQPAFGASSAPAFGASSAPAFGGSSSPSFSFGSAPAFGQSASTFGSSPFGATSSPFGAQSSPFGAQATTPTFGSSGQSAFGAQRGGSRVVPYTATTETDVGAGAQAGKLESISAMPTYKDKSHEELRWEDYQLGDKGGPAAPGQSPSGIGFGVSAAQSNPFATSSPFGQSSAGAFSTPASSNPFAPKTSTFLSSSTPSFSSPFATSSSPNPFQSTVGTTSPFGQSSSPSLFGTASTSAFGSTPSLFSSSTPQGGLSFANTQASPFQSTTPAFGQTGSAFGSTFGQSTTPSFTPGLFNTPSTGFGGSLFSSTPSLNTSTSLFGQTTPSQSSPFQLSQPSQPPASGFGGFGQTQMAGSSGFPGASSMFGQSNFGQLAATQGSAAVQPMPVTNPFGTLPAMPQVSIGRSGTTPSVQYGISSLPVVDKPAPLRISSLLTTRHLSQRRFRLPSQKYHPKNDGQKVPFFSDEEDTPSNPKADALFIPRENPRALFIRPVDQWPQKAKKVSPMKDASTPVNENGTVLKFNNASVNGTVDGQRDAEDGMRKEQADHVRPNQKSNGIHEDHSTERQEPYVTLNGHRAGEAAIVYEHGADIEAMMPKLRRSDYYTEPKIQELAAKERAEPGFCRHVKDFVVGRHGYGSIKFFGETDVRRLDLESIVQFNNKEVIVYVDDSKKPPVGQGLNKPAEVTLLNIKCFDKKTKQQYTEGPKVEKYREMLIKRTEEQGAEFVLYDPVKGEWKFRVKHFSKYVLDDETQEEEEEKEETCGERKEEEGKEESCGKRRKS